MKKLLAYSLIAPLGAALLISGCKKLSCGTGTVEKDGECRASLGGAGGESNEPSRSVSFSGVRAAAAASETALLAVWTPAEEDDVTYNVYVAQSKDGFNYAQPQAELDVGASSALISGLKSKGTYFVQVRAVVDGKIVPNAAVAEVTLEADSENPEFAGVVDAATAADASVKLSWDPAQDDVTPKEAITYFVYVGSTAEDVNFQVPIASSLPGASSTVVQLPEPDTEYFFAVRAQDAAGRSDENTVVVAATSGSDTTAPAFAGCTTAIARTASSIVASFNPASDDIATSDKLSYRIYAAESVEQLNFAAPDVVITDGSTSASIPHLKQDTPYVVVCRAADPSGNEDDNLVYVSARTKDDGEPPVFSGAVTVSDTTTTTAALSWTPGTDNKSKPNQLVYAVFVSQFEEDLIDFDPTTFPVFAESAPGVDSIVLEKLTSNNRYYAVVLAKDGGENYSKLTTPVVFETQVSFLNDVMIGIIGPRQCASTECHQGAAATGQLSLEVDVAWQNLVNVDAATSLGSGFKRVVPFDSVNSHLVHRIKGTGPLEGNVIGNRMPIDGDSLSSESIATIEKWIDQGAENN